MIPLLSPLSAGCALGAFGSVPAPHPRFRAIVGELRNITMTIAPMESRGMTEAQKNGLRYERRVHDFLFRKYDSYLPSPTFSFTDDSGFRRVIPDGLFVSPARIIIVEIKISHMPEAWWQLKRLYEPVIAKWSPERRVYSLEIVKTFDPATPFPGKFDLIDNLEEWLENPTALAVYRWRTKNAEVA